MPRPRNRNYRFSHFRFILLRIPLSRRQLISESTMDVTVTVRNQAKWDIVKPIAEMEVTKKGRCLNPPLKYSVRGLEKYATYIPSIEFERKTMQYKFDKENKEWKPWRLSEPLPEQSWTMEAKMGSEMMELGIDFSALLITSDKGTEATSRAVLQSLHVYTPILVLTPVEEPEKARRFKAHCQDFVVVTKVTERLREHRALLGPEEPTKKKRAPETVDAPKAKRAKKSSKETLAPEDEMVMNSFFYWSTPAPQNDENQPPAHVVYH